jgi:Prenyltransferase and squalene oxidase repeat
MDWLKALYQKFPWFMISTGIVLSIAFLVSLIVVGTESKPVQEVVQTVKVSNKVEKPAEELIQPEEEIERKSIPKNVESELVSYEEDTFILPDDAPDPNQDLHLDLGDPEGVDNLPTGATGGTSAGVGTGGHLGSGVSAFASRRVGSGGKGRRPLGVTQATEASVLEGLRWLIRHQNPDGSWAANSLNEVCTQGSPCWPPTLDGNGKEIARTSHYDEGLTALSLLAFLGAGHGHDSRVKIVDTQMAKAYTIGDVVKKGLQWLRDRQNEDGSFSRERFMYNEVLAAMAMTEAYGLTQARAWKDPAQKAIDFLVAAQKKNPNGSGLWGWRYHARSLIEERKERGEIDDAEYAQLIYDADTSVTTWAVMAFKSAQMSGLKVPEEAMDGAMSFIRFVTPRGKGGDSGAAANQTGAPRDTGSYSGKVGYLDAARAGEKVTGPRDMFTYYPEAMSALGMCSRIFINHDHSDPFLRPAAELIAKKPPTAKDKLNIDYYYWYYGTLALNQYDGPDSPNKGRGGYWDRWNKAMNDAILELQDKTETKDICNKGGWLTLDRWSYSGGPIYTTATNVLSLEVYYRFENAFGSGPPKKGAKPK